MDVSRGHLCVSVRRGHRLQMFHVVSCDGLFSSFLRRSLFTSSSASARSDRLFSHLASCFVFFVPHFCVGCWALCIGVAVACAVTDGEPTTLEIILSRVSARVRGTVAPPPWCSVCGVSTAPPVANRGVPSMHFRRLWRCLCVRYPCPLAYRRHAWPVASDSLTKGSTGRGVGCACVASLIH